MKHWLLALVLMPLSAGSIFAAPQPAGTWSISEPAAAPAPRFNFRLVADPDFDPRPIHNSGMIAQTEVMPNGTLGIGLLKASPKKFGSGDWRQEPGAPRSRKAAVSFQLRF